METYYEDDIHSVHYFDARFFVVDIVYTGK